ncbi:MAG TPA: ankyrin repeat domain-containing protein [Steroidobacter sp.]
MTKTDNKRLFKAIEDNDFETIEQILRKNTDAMQVVGISNKFCRDKTPLMYAMQSGRFDLVRKFIDLGADVNARMAGGPGTHVLALAMIFGHPGSPCYKEFVEVARDLIARGADPSVALWPALCRYDRANGRSEMVELLIERGADVNYRLPNGKTVQEMLKITQHTPRVLQLCGVTESRPE